MHNPSTASTAGTAVQLVSAWADFTKAFVVYPSTNIRVRNELESFLQHVHSSLSGRRALAVTLHSDHAMVGDERVETDDRPNLEWLKERLDDAGLAGVEFRSGVDADAFRAFTETLARSTTHRAGGGDIEELWQEEFGGLRPLDRRFLLHGGDGADAERSWATSTAQGRMLLELLESSRDVRGQLDRLESALLDSAGEQDASPDTVQLDLVARLVDLLPADVLRDPAKAVEAATGVLSRLQDEVDRLGAGSLDGHQIERMLLSVGRKYFSDEWHDADWQRMLPDDETSPQRAQELEIEESLSELLSELALLPDLDGGFDLGGEVPDEQLGVYLHFVNALAADETAARVHAPLAEALRAAESRLELLESQLALAASTAEAGDVEPLRRLIGFLQQSGLIRLARECGFLTLARTRMHFEELCGPFLQTLDWRHQGHVHDLEQLCHGAGPERILAARADILTNGTFARGDTASRLLQTPREALLPLVLLVLEERGEAVLREACWCLKKLELKDREAALLRLGFANEIVTLDYLSLLAQRKSRGVFPQQLPDVVASLLIPVLEDASVDAGRRIEVVGVLSEFLESREVRDALRRVSRARGVLGLGGAPAALRKAAGEVLRSIIR